MNYPLPKVILLLSLLVHIAAGHHNITVDDADLPVKYTGRWVNSTNDPFSFKGRYMATQDPEARATFTFTGSSNVRSNHPLPIA